MEREAALINQIKNEGMLPLFYHDDVTVCENVLQALYNGGVRCVEFTNRGVHALPNFKHLVSLKTTMPGLILGIGTIKTPQDATSFIEAGADFLISPCFDASVADVAYMHKVLWIPGCMTPTEIHVAQKSGATLIKLFPGNVLGPGFVEAIKTLFTGVDFLVTGGVEPTEQNIGAWFKAGVSGVGLGSKLITKDVLANKNYTQLEIQTKELVQLIKKVQ
jgi:2-dehydro-3-deoxyphosphogluconate aldolase / (4S)-4-hydroxy-2-oxoglutarate aldolase